MGFIINLYFATSSRVCFAELNNRMQSSILSRRLANFLREILRNTSESVWELPFEWGSKVKKKQMSKLNTDANMAALRTEEYATKGVHTE